MTNLNNVICGLLLGDATINLKSDKKARLGIKHKLEDASYLIAKQNILNNYPEINFGSNQPYFVKDKDGNPAFESVTLSCNYLKKIHAIWYKSVTNSPNEANFENDDVTDTSNKIKYKKILPRDFVEKNLDEVALSFWYQDDGNLKNYNYITLSTECFALEDIKFLVQLLKSKFNIKASIDGEKRIIITSRLEVNSFLSIIKNHLLYSMQRKYPHSYEDTLSQKTVELLMNKKELSNQFSIVKYNLSENAINKISNWNSVPFNNWLTKTLLKELTFVLSLEHRIEQINNFKSIKEEFFTLNGSPQLEHTIRISISNFNKNALHLLKQWTGLTISEYLDLLLQQDIPELENFTVVQLSEKSGVKRTTINNYIKVFSNFFPFIKISKQHFYDSICLEVLAELNSHKNKRRDKILSILSSKFPELLD